MNFYSSNFFPNPGHFHSPKHTNTHTCTPIRTDQVYRVFQCLQHTTYLSRLNGSACFITYLKDEGKYKICLFYWCPKTENSQNNNCDNLLFQI